nr:hypothetical protein [Tanacetum cinerariifolium]
MWKSAKTIAPTPNSAIIQLDVDNNFLINSTHLNMIRENKFDGYLRADPHDHIREFLAICDMFEYGKTESEAVKLLIFSFSLSDKAKTWFNELNEETITSLDAWLRLKSILRKCHGHGLTKGAIIEIFYRGLDEPTQGILDGIVRGIFFYKSPNQAFQFLEDKGLFEHDWPIKSQMAMDSQIISLNEELQDIRNEYNDLREENSSKNHLHDDMPMCEHDEANYIRSEDYQNQNSHDSHSYQSYHDHNDSEKLLTELNNDLKKDLEDFKSYIRSMRIIHDKLYDRDD